MKIHSRELLIYYNPESSDHRKTIAHAQGVSNHLKLYAFGQTPSTTTSWQQILKRLNVHPKELMNKAHPYYQEHIRGRDFDDDSWLNVLRRNPDLLRAPIAMRGKRAIICYSPTDVLRLISG